MTTDFLYYHNTPEEGSTNLALAPNQNTVFKAGTSLNNPASETAHGCLEPLLP